MGGTEKMSVFLEPTAVHGWTQRGREHMSLLHRNAERTGRKAPAALRGNTAVPEYRNGLFREKYILLKPGWKRLAR